jgi:hypothetical protein
MPVRLLAFHPGGQTGVIAFDLSTHRGEEFIVVHRLCSH